ncbi:Six-hairpin glycosidase-like protein [Delphinella strobiligena]|nr:Six-hairpin glycosidase-like protein [Delphinella strobiligena]
MALLSIVFKERSADMTLVLSLLIRVWIIPSILAAVLHCYAQDPIRPYPLPDSYLVETSFLDHASYVQDLDDPQWYYDNIPFVDLPDQSMQDVFYYRASVIKRHIRWNHEGHGFGITEFIHPVSWASKFQTIPDSAAYHILETRWLRNPYYSKNLIDLYMRGGVEKLSGISYTHVIQEAVLEHAQATGDVEALTSQLDGLITTYDLWNITRDNTTGLYHRTPLSDAQEYSLPGYLTGGPGGGPMEVWDDFGLTVQQGGGNDYNTIWLGPETYRPNFNAYMIANARAISTVANLTGQTSLAQIWSDYADTVYANMEDLLWSDSLQFWIDVVEGTNLKCEGRELIGYFPYRFGVGTSQEYVAGLEAGLTTEHFITGFGPTTLEQTNPYYTALKNTTYCCVWQGQSWPFSTSVYLNTLSMLARDNVSTVATAAFFQDALQTYVRTDYKDGAPYTAESHYPTIDEWSGDTTNHSEHYFHSTYINNIFTDLLGIRPTLLNELQLFPLIPTNWTHFAVENLLYHGTILTILWDETGTHYKAANHTAGLSIYSNGTLFYTSKTLRPVNITLPFNTTTAATTLTSTLQYQNILANANAPWGLPNITASYDPNTNGDYGPFAAWKMIDGLLWYDTLPQNHWTQNQSTRPWDVLQIQLPRARNISSISLAFLDDLADGGVITCPSAIRVTTSNGSVLAERKPWSTCKGNALNTIAFTTPANYIDPGNATTSASGYGYEVETDFLQLDIADELGYSFSISEIQLWVPPQPRTPLGRRRRPPRHLRRFLPGHKRRT